MGKLIWAILAILPVPYLILWLDSFMFEWEMESYHSTAVAFFWLPFFATVIVGILSSRIQVRYVILVNILMAILSIAANIFYPISNKSRLVLYVDNITILIIEITFIYRFFFKCWGREHFSAPLS